MKASQVAFLLTRASLARCVGAEKITARVFAFHVAVF